MRLAELIREEREKRGWSKSGLARAAGLSPSAISRLEKGEVLGRSDSIARITRALGISSDRVKDLLTGEDRANLSDSDEARDLQLTDLSKVPPNDRAKLRRAIIELVRSFEEDEPGEATG